MSLEEYPSCVLNVQCTMASYCGGGLKKRSLLYFSPYVLNSIVLLRAQSKRSVSNICSGDTVRVLHIARIGLLRSRVDTRLSRDFLLRAVSCSISYTVWGLLRVCCCSCIVDAVVVIIVVVAV